MTEIILPTYNLMFKMIIYQYLNAYQIQFNGLTMVTVHKDAPFSDEEVTSEHSEDAPGALTKQVKSLVYLNFFPDHFAGINVITIYHKC